MKRKSSSSQKPGAAKKTIAANLRSHLYRGRLTPGLDPDITRYISSIREDFRIADADINLNRAHALLLKKAGFLSSAELARILQGLRAAEKELHRLNTSWPAPEIESNFVDIHPWIESFVIQKCGILIGGKLHLAKSRNDQVMTDTRMVLRAEIINIAHSLIILLSRLLVRAADEKDTVMPAYTHTQPAQISSYGHYLLALCEPLFRDLERLSDSYPRLNLLPLGAGANAGSRIRLDRALAARYLGFDGVAEHSTDATSSRDFFIEIGSVFLSLSVSLSRIAGDCILWMSPGWNMVELPDKYADTSSALPQKKNPDPFEMVRSKTHLIRGLFDQIASAPAGLPTGYHKDFQEIKKSIFGIIDELIPTLTVMGKMLPELILHRGTMAELCTKSGVAALDLAEALAESTSLPFREAHRMVGTLVRESLKRKIEIEQADPRWVSGLPEVLRQAGITSLATFLKPTSLIRRRISRGGPSPSEVTRMVRSSNGRLRAFRKLWKQRESKLADSQKAIQAAIRNAISMR